VVNQALGLCQDVAAMKHIRVRQLQSWRESGEALADPTDLEATSVLQRFNSAHALFDGPHWYEHGALLGKVLCPADELRRAPLSRARLLRRSCSTQ
jgi:hypothetical protein